ncbi:MAG: hypothetical protein SFU86_20270 [Pirellulaceae bacterium]|nr:hypothetical protein [Pirellulaceae bacterium]
MVANPMSAVQQLTAAPQGQLYYLAWRTRPNHPWHSQEFDNRRSAHQRYMRLVELGLEVYLERRTAPA